MDGRRGRRATVSGSRRKKVGETITVEMTVQASKDASKKRGEIYLDAELDFRDEKNFAVVITKDGAADLRAAGIDEPATHFKDKKIRADGYGQGSRQDSAHRN